MEQADARTDRPPRQRTRAQDSWAPATKHGAYLRKLREGYGYTLRRVEEQSNALGEAIAVCPVHQFQPVVEHVVAPQKIPPPPDRPTGECDSGPA